LSGSSSSIAQSARVSARSRAENLLERLQGPEAALLQGIFVEIDNDVLLAQADAADERRRSGHALGPLDGCLVAVKDLFDVQGQVTRAGSRILRDEPAAQRDATCIARLRRAGVVFVGRTNMSEFAFSGLGLNPHYGTPHPPGYPDRVPGGSTSGGAVAVATALVDAALGTDTSGSVRIPAAYCGLSGWKPSWERVPSAGVFPLATTLDSVGVIAPSMALCRQLDAVLAAESLDITATSVPAAVLRLGVPGPELLDGMDALVASAFERALNRLSAAGCELLPLPLRAVVSLRSVMERGGFVTPEAFAFHRHRLDALGELFDPLVRRRMEMGRDAWPAAEWEQAQALRQQCSADADEALAGLSALILPTTPTVAPMMQDVITPAGFAHHNALAIRNTMWANILGLCSAALPMKGSHPSASLMLFGRGGDDLALLRVAAALEPLVADC